MIECDLVPITEYSSLVNTGSKKKAGRYHGSMFWDVPGFGSKKWVIAAKIIITGNIPIGYTDDEVIGECLNYINTPPPRRKFQKRVRRPKYGKLDLYRGQIKTGQGLPYISALLVTESRKSKHFWGKGIVL